MLQILRPSTTHLPKHFETPPSYIFTGPPTAMAENRRVLTGDPCFLEASHSIDEPNRRDTSVEYPDTGSAA
jgi:hypothetical protein